MMFPYEELLDDMAISASLSGVSLPPPPFLIYDILL